MPAETTALRCGTRVMTTSSMYALHGLLYITHWKEMLTDRVPTGRSISAPSLRQKVAVEKSTTCLFVTGDADDDDDDDDDEVVRITRK